MSLSSLKHGLALVVLALVVGLPLFACASAEDSAPAPRVTSLTIAAKAPSSGAASSMSCAASSATPSGRASELGLLVVIGAMCAMAMRRRA